MDLGKSVLVITLVTTLAGCSNAGGAGPKAHAVFMPTREGYLNTLSRQLMLPEYGVNKNNLDKLPYPTSKDANAPDEYLEKNLHALESKVISHTLCVFSFTVDQPSFEVHTRGGSRLLFTPTVQLNLDAAERKKELESIEDAKKEYGVDDETLRRAGAYPADIKVTPEWINAIILQLTNAFPGYAADLKDVQHLDAELVPGTQLGDSIHEETCLFFNRNTGRYFLSVNSYPTNPIVGMFKPDPIRPWSKQK